MHSKKNQWPPTLSSYPPPSLHQLHNSHTWLLASLLNYLPPWPQCHCLFIHSYLQGKGLVGTPACTQLPTHIFLCCDGGTKAPSAGDGISRASCVPRAAVGAAGWAPVGQEQLLQPGTARRQEIKPALPGSHCKFSALWVALMGKLTSLKMKSASWTTISVFQGAAGVPVRTQCPLKCLSWVTINLINKNHSELLSAVSQLDNSSFPLWLHLLSIAQSCVFWQGLHKAFSWFWFFFLFSSQYQTTPRSHYFYHLEVFCRILLYKLLKKVSHYNPITGLVFFLQHLFPLPYMTILLFLLCRNTVLQLQITDF